MEIKNITGYKFICLNELTELRQQLLSKCEALALKGTILLSSEGINLNLSGLSENVDFFITHFYQDERFKDITFRKSYSVSHPFKYMRVKLRKEIITMRCPEVQPEKHSAPVISPQVLKLWLDDKKDMTLLDTRNDYEVRFGTFCGAKNLNIEDFSQFPGAINSIERNKPVVMFCTGGIRCEKAALYLLEAGFNDVFQLQGGILNYFSEVGGEYYQGECFVFDHRIAVNESLEATGSIQCDQCQGPITKQDNEKCPICI